MVLRSIALRRFVVFCATCGVTLQARKSLATRFHDLLDELFEDRIVDWSLADARACARIMEDKRRRGEPLDDHVPDAFLAAAAASRGLAVATRNTGEFRNTGVTTVDPWTATPR